MPELPEVESARRVIERSALGRRIAAVDDRDAYVCRPHTPGQIDAANEVYSPRQEDYDHAELILEAYAWHTSEAGGLKGAVMLGGEMIDEASRKMAEVLAGKGRAAGMQRTQKFEPPTQ